MSFGALSFGGSGCTLLGDRRVRVNRGVIAVRARSGAYSLVDDAAACVVANPV